MRRLQSLAIWSLAACFSASAQVSFDRIRAAEREPGNWLTYSGNYSAHRHSPLDQIHAGNVQKLKPGVGLSNQRRGAGGDDAAGG